MVSSVTKMEYFQFRVTTLRSVTFKAQDILKRMAMMILQDTSIAKICTIGMELRRCEGDDGKVSLRRSELIHIRQKSWEFWSWTDTNRTPYSNFLQCNLVGNFLRSPWQNIADSQGHTGVNVSQKKFSLKELHHRNRKILKKNVNTLPRQFLWRASVATFLGSKVTWSCCTASPFAFARTSP